MGAQRLDAVVATRQFRLGQGGVDFVVTDLMQQNDRPTLAAAQFRRQVMQALLGIRRDRAIAERADGDIVHEPQEWRGRALGQGEGRHG